MPKIVKILLITLTGFLALLLILWLLLQNHRIQTVISQKLSESVSKKLGAELTIKSVSIHFFDHLELERVLLRDLRKDTLIYIEKLDADYRLLNWSSESIHFDNIILEKAVVKLVIPENDSSLNLKFLVEFFQPETPNPNAKSPRLSSDRIVLNNCFFNFRNENYTASENRAFNENDIRFSQINGTLKDFEIIEDSLHFYSKDLNTTEASGLQIKKLQAWCTISSTVMDFDKLSLITPRSSIGDKLRFSYNSYNSFADFIDSVYINAQLSETNIHSKDVEYFSSDLNVYNELIQASGEISGTISNLKGKNTQLNLSGHSTFKGDFKIRGVTDADNGFWDIDAEYFETNIKDFLNLLQISNSSPELLALGNIRYQGNFTGFLREFVSYGTLYTSLGQAETDLKFGINAGGKEIYSGRVRSKALNFSKLLEGSGLGAASFDLQIKGEGLDMESLDAAVSGNISRIQYKDYIYQNIDLKGKLKQNIYDGFASIDDPNLKLEFTGKIDATSENALIDINTIVREMNLSNLGLDKQNSVAQFQGKINMQGSNLDNVQGNIVLDSFFMLRDSQFFSLKEIQLLAEFNESGRHFMFRSDLGNADLSGHFKIANLDEIVKDIVYLIYPGYGEPGQPDPDTDISMGIKLHQEHPLLDALLEDVHFNDLSASLDYNAARSYVQIKGNIPAAGYRDMRSNLLQVNLYRKGLSDTPSIQLSLGQLTINDSLLFNRVDVNAQARRGRYNFKVHADRDDSFATNIDAYLTAVNDSISVFFNTMDLLINHKLWEMQKTSFPNIVYHNGLTELFYFDLRNGRENLFFDAAFGTNTNKLNIVVDQFMLNNLNPFIASMNMQVEGIANGYIDLTYRDGFPIFESDLVIEHLSIDNDTLGHFSLQSTSGKHPLQVVVKGEIESGLLDGMSIGGFVDFKSPQNALDIQIKTEKSSVRPFEKYLSGLASNINGYFKADMQLSGPLKSPRISGKADFTELRFKVDYLQTTYTAQASVEVGNNYFKILDATIKDRFGKTGKPSGIVRHNNYSDFIFDLSIKDLNQFECMNTTRADNGTFYGSAYADGYMEIKGPMEDILLLIRAKSRKGTKIYIPLDNVESDGQMNYVQFVNLKSDINKIKEPVKTSEGVQMDFNFEITNDADVELIFDELLGDKIKASGHGNLRMEINTYGVFNMYGAITIDRGSYLFTAFNIINKYFTVSPGGTISWDGNPYNATINLDAVKREYPRPSTLLAGTTGGEEFDQPVPVDCHLKLSGLLFNPNISFDISFPSQGTISGGSNSTFTTVIERVRQDKEELDRQVFALLALGTFIPPSFSDASGVYSAGTGIQNSVNNSLSDFVSSQLSNWFSQISPRFQVGVDYQGATSENANAELVLSLKRKFLDDRLELQGSYDAGATNGSRPYDLNVLYNLSKDGSLKVSGFQRNANDPTLNNLTNVTTSGIGFFYRHQFDHFRLRRKEEPQDSLVN